MKIIAITGFASFTFVISLAIMGDVPISAALTFGGTTLAVATGSRFPLG